MRFLAIETSSLTGSLALFEDVRCVGEERFPEGMVHGREITPRLQILLSRTGTQAASIEGLAVSGGPGSYTGCRVGMTAAKSLGFSLRVPVVAVSSLEVLASGACTRSGRGKSDALVAPVLDGRRGKYYVALFRRSSGAQPNRLLEDRIGTTEQIARWLAEKASSSARVSCCGDGAAAFLAGFSTLAADCEGSSLRVERAAAENDIPAARTLGELAASRLRGARFDLETLHKLQVTYLRPSEPEVRWQRGEFSGVTSRVSSALASSQTPATTKGSAGREGDS